MSFSSAPDGWTNLSAPHWSAIGQCGDHMTSSLPPTGQIGHPRSHLVLMVLLWPLNTALKYKLELKVPVKKLNIPPRNVVSQGLHLYVFMRETKLVYIKQIVRFIIIIRGKLSTLHVWVLSIKVG